MRHGWATMIHFRKLFPVFIVVSGSEALAFLPPICIGDGVNKSVDTDLNFWVASTISVCIIMFSLALRHVRTGSFYAHNVAHGIYVHFMTLQV